MMMGALACLSLTGCRDQDYDWEAAKMQSTIYTYKKNFEKIYGPIDPNQSWDFSTPNGWSTSSTRSTTSITFGYGVGCETGDNCSGFDQDGWYTVEQNTLDWMASQLVEGQNNSSKGSPFTMKMPNNSFTLVPIYRGYGGSDYNLSVVVVNEDGTIDTETVVWERAQWKNTKGSYIQYKTEENQIWQDGSSNKGTCSGKADDQHVGIVTDIRGRAFTISGIPEGKEIYFKIHNYTRTTDLNDNDYNLTSKDGYMILLGCDTPSNIDSNKHEVRMMGCENRRRGDTKSADNDFNDVVFLIIGNKEVPKEYRITKKRYMVEDLGNADDIDFNDIVVDLEERQFGHLETTATQSVFVPEGQPIQTAIVRAMGGTLDFDFLIGDEIVFQKSVMENSTYSFSTMYNTEGTIDYSAELAKSFRAEDGSSWTWTPSENNVSFVVYPSGRSSNGVATTITFPDLGEVPYIMAFDPTKPWRDERHTICTKWLNGLENGISTCNDCKDDKVFGK